MRTVIITEVAGEDRHWTVDRDGAVTRMPTAAEALHAVQAEDTATVEAGAKMALTKIEWNWTTNVGRDVVRVLTNGKADGKVRVR